MTADEHFRTLIFDLLVRVAQLAAEVDALKAQLAKPESQP